LTHIAGKHSMKFGAEYRLIHNADTPRTNGMGNYSFDVDWTRRTPDFADPNSGNGIATFLLGNISSGSVSINAATYTSWKYPVLYFQDDWQVTRRLTLNMGIRWEEQAPGVDRFNQQVGYVDLNAPFPIVVPGMPNLKGGLTYAGVNGVTRGAFNPDWWNLQPRFGFAYKVLRSKPLVFRGGVGRTFIRGCIKVCVNVLRDN
jgi:outer membrane receptor protein involved in Fe transport